MPQSFDLAVARGMVPSVSSVRKFGRNEEIGTVEETVWTGGGLWPFPESASAVRIEAGGHADDTAAGDGARSITIVGLDENWNQVTETIATNGVLASDPTTATFIRVYRAYVEDVGTYGAASTADIRIESTTALVTCMIIAAGLGQTQMAVYAIPAGYTGYLIEVFVKVESTKAVSFTMFHRHNGNIIAAPMKARRMVVAWSNVDDQVVHNYKHSGITFDEYTDIWINGKSNGGTASATVEFELHLVKN